MYYILGDDNKPLAVISYAELHAGQTCESDGVKYLAVASGKQANNEFYGIRELRYVHKPRRVSFDDTDNSSLPGGRCIRWHRHSEAPVAR